MDEGGKKLLLNQIQQAQNLLKFALSRTKQEHPVVAVRLAFAIEQAEVAKIKLEGKDATRQ